MARFTKKGKLSLERNSIKAPMGGLNSVGDLLTMRTLKNIIHIHIQIIVGLKHLNGSVIICYYIINSVNNYSLQYKWIFLNTKCTFNPFFFYIIQTG